MKHADLLPRWHYLCRIEGFEPIASRVSGNPGLLFFLRVVTGPASQIGEDLEHVIWLQHRDERGWNKLAVSLLYDLGADEKRISDDAYLREELPSVLIGKLVRFIVARRRDRSVYIGRLSAQATEAGSVGEALGRAAR